MARIPIEERSSGSPWWLWLLGLILLAGVIWLVAGLFDGPDAEVVAVEPDPIEAPAYETDAMTTGEITSVATILDAANPATLAGREVQLAGMRVTEVVGDSTFYVTPTDASTDRRLFVVLDEQMNEPPANVEGRYDVTEGQMVTVMGSLRALERTDPDVWGITGNEAQRMMDDAVYLRAQRLDITSPANMSQATN